MEEPAALVHADDHTLTHDIAPDDTSEHTAEELRHVEDIDQAEEEPQLEEAPHTEDAPEPPHIDEPIQTDSMVTIRLSEPGSAAEPFAEDELTSENASRDLPADLSAFPGRPSSLEIMHGEVPETSTTEEASATEEEADVVPQLSNDPTDFEPQDESRLSEPKSDPRRSRRSSTISLRSEGSSSVDWVALEKTEEEESREEHSDESTAFLLARLEQENNTLATDPRFGGIRERSGTRPPSIHVLKKLVNDPTAAPTRYSLLPDPPPMTELEFWAALVKDYAQTAQRLPTLTTNKIRGGVPPPLRGVVWVSMCGARDRLLEEEYDRLCGESSPYENLIGKDIGRSFPGVEMFRDPEGDGQKMLGKVLKCFSLYDQKIGYCQGLGFIVGPLLMQMEDKDAFCVLVRLMDNYDLRSCFLPDLSGLHLRIFQFQRLLSQHMPELAQHLTSLGIEPAYLSKWFLSFFAITCPLPMLFRIYDVIFAEGASETMMRVALSLMKRNEAKIMASNEFEEVIQLLLGRALWEPYNHNADDLVADFMRYSPGGPTESDDLTAVVTRESLQLLENAFKEAQAGDSASRGGIFPDVSTAASRFLGRLWTSTTLKPAATLSPAPATPTRPTSMLHRTPSKMSIATVNSTDVSSDNSTVSTLSSQTTDTTVVSRESTTDFGSNKSIKSKPESIAPGNQSVLSKEDRDLYGQIEDLLTALTETQRDQAMMATQLQREREERSEDHRAFRALIDRLKSDVALPSSSQADRRRTTIGQELPAPSADPVPILSLCADLGNIVDRVEDRLIAHEELRRSTILETKQRLRDSLVRSKNQAQIEATRARELSRQVEEQEQELRNVREELRDARSRLQESHSERQKLERSVQEFRSQRSSRSWSESPLERPGVLRSETSDSVSRSSMSSASGLRELRLGNSSTPSTLGAQPQQPPRRTSSLAASSLLATDDHQPSTADELLVELVNSKTAEATAKQELEEVRGRLDAMRKMLSMPSPPLPSPAATGLHRASPSEATVTAPSPPPPPATPAKATPPSSAGSGLSGFWGWGKRSASTTAAVAEK